MAATCLKKTWMRIILAAVVLSITGAVSSALAASHPQSPLNLVSIGVGDADLITVRAIDTIKASDVIICRRQMAETFADYLKGKQILDDKLSGWRTYRRNCADIKDPKKRAACLENTKTRARLISTIRDAVREGKTVSVLGSGDLLIYGGPYRWYLEEFKDLNPRIIPGVSCFNAANAALGRDIMTGKESHSAVLTTYREIDKLAPSHPTMIIFTMHTEFADLVAKLKNHYAPESPIAIVFHAGYKDKENILKGRLDTILQQTRGRAFPFEHLVYVGDFMK